MHIIRNLRHYLIWEDPSGFECSCHERFELRFNLKLSRDLICRLFWPRVVGSVTRLGDLLDFGQLFKAFGNN